MDEYIGLDVAAHHHVVLHALAKRADRSDSRASVHGKFPSLKGTPWSDAGLASPKASEYHATLRPGAPPAQRFRPSRRSSPGAQGADSALDFGANVL
jgi:hypothetical protein